MSDKEYLKLLKERAEELITEPISNKTSKPKTKKEMTLEQKNKVLENLAKGRTKALEARQIKRQIKDKQKEEEIKEFESLQEKYLGKVAKREPPKEKPKRQYVEPPPMKEEVQPEIKHEIHEEKPKPIETPKIIETPKPVEKKSEPIPIPKPVITPSQPVINRPSYYMPTMSFIKKYQFN
jgi:hypothetical protein